MKTLLSVSSTRKRMNSRGMRGENRGLNDASLMVFGVGTVEAMTEIKSILRREGISVTVENRLGAAYCSAHSTAQELPLLSGYWSAADTVCFQSFSITN